MEPPQHSGASFFVPSLLRVTVAAAFTRWNLRPRFASSAFAPRRARPYSRFKSLFVPLSSTCARFSSGICPAAFKRSARFSSLFSEYVKVFFTGNARFL
jgi:hypothetical protein